MHQMCPEIGWMAYVFYSVLVKYSISNFVHVHKQAIIYFDGVGIERHHCGTNIDDVNDNEQSEGHN